MAKKIMVQRVRGFDSEPMRMDTQFIEDVKPATREGNSMVILSGHRVEVRGTVDEINQLIADAPDMDEGQDYFENYKY